MYQIEKGIELPKRQKAKKYPFNEMETGDSFFVQNGNIGSINSISFQMQKKIPGRKFSVRKVDGGVRVWRVE